MLDSVADVEPQLPEAAKDALTQMIRLHELSVEMSQASSETVMLRLAVQGALRHLRIDRMAVFLKEEDDPQYIRGTWGTDETGKVINESAFRCKLADLSEHEMVRIALRDQNYLAILRDVDLRLDGRVVGKGWNAMIGLWYGDDALGWLACDNLLTQSELLPVDIEILKLFAATLSQAIVRGRAEENLKSLNHDLELRVAARTVELNSANEALEVANAELKKLSRLDGLTGIANRRLFDETLKQEWARCAREGKELSVVMIDVDHFKQYNDHLGHIAGDAALVAVAGALAHSVWRPGDLPARYGGEEFALLLPQTGKEGALSIAERVRDAVRELKLPHPHSSAGEIVTVSLGVASALPPEGTAAKLLTRADDALYLAKEAGRNRVRVD